MSLEYDPTSNLQHYPIPMRRFGLNPYGDPLYRIVFTQSRRHLVGGMWPDGSTGYHWVPKYRAVKAAWILEEWRMPDISRREWESLTDPISGWPLLGPYPNRGEYELAFQFDLGVSADSIDNIIAALNHKRKRSFQDCRDEAADQYQQEEKDTRNACQAEIRDAVTAFGVAPISSLTGVSRGSKTAPELRSAQELGLPIPGGGGRPTNLRGLNFGSSLMAGRA